MTRYVYILSDHGEYGAENVCATLDRSLLIGMVEQNWPVTRFFPVYGNRQDRTDEEKAVGLRIAEAHRKDWIARGVAGLASVLERSDETLAGARSGHNCHEGWGGMQLHVVELTGAP